MSYQDMIKDVMPDKNAMQNGELRPYAEIAAEQAKATAKQTAERKAWAEKQIADARKIATDKVNKDLTNTQKALNDTTSTFDRDINQLKGIVAQYTQAGYPADSQQIQEVNGRIDWFEKQKQLKTTPLQATIDHATSLQNDMKTWDDARYLKESGSYQSSTMSDILKNTGRYDETQVKNMIGGSMENSMSDKQQAEHDATIAAAGEAPTPTHLPSEQEKEASTTYDIMPTRDYTGSDITNNPKFAAVEGTPNNGVTDVPVISDINPQVNSQTTPQGTETASTGTQGTNGTTTPDGTTGTPTTQTTPSGEVIQTNGNVGMTEALAAIDADSRIPDDLKPLFKRVVEGWDPNQELNIDNVIGKFNEIKDTTIDPYFKEQIQQFTNDLNTTLEYQNKNNALENEQMKTSQAENIRGTQQGLEASGRIFTGEGVRQLGNKSAYAQQGKGNIPGQTPFAGGQFAEGMVNQQNRLMSTSTALRQKKAAEDLARQAEKTLGTSGAQNLGLQTKGDVTQGSIGEAQQKAQASALEGVYNQQQNLNQYSEPVKIF